MSIIDYGIRLAKDKKYEEAQAWLAYAKPAFEAVLKTARMWGYMDLLHLKSKEEYFIRRGIHWSSRPKSNCYFCEFVAKEGGIELFRAAVKDRFAYSCVACPAMGISWKQHCMDSILQGSAYGFWNSHRDTKVMARSMADLRNKWNNAIELVEDFLSSRKIINVAFEYVETSDEFTCSGCLFEDAGVNNEGKVKCPAMAKGSNFLCKGIINRIISVQVK